MSDQDRGAYTPQPDAPLQFDARGPRGRRPLPMTLIGSGGVLVVLLVLYFGATAWLVHKVFRLLGKPDMDVR